jgi:signal transduction histidine kinase
MNAVRWLRIALWPTTLAAGGLTAWLLLTSGNIESPGLVATFGLVIGLLWSITGLEEWRRRPGNRIGPLMVLVGLTWFAGLLQDSSVSVLFTVGLFFTALHIAFFAHVLLAFPSGRLESRLARCLVAAAYIDTTLGVAASVVFDDVREGDARNLALVHADDTLAEVFGSLAPGIGVALTVASLVVLALRWRRATPPWRRVVAPVLWSGWAAAAVGGLNLLVETMSDENDALGLAFLVVYASVPVAFKVGLLRTRFARGAVADLVVELGEVQAPGELREALARALHDPSLAVAYWLPEQARYVDVDGHPFQLPSEGSEQVATIVEREGRRVAALVHDPSVRDTAGLIEAVGAAAGLALENERLQAELRARLDELRAASARIVEATVSERKRIERNLHDGTQQRLVSISMALGLAESRLAADPEGARRMLGEAREGLAVALEELRELSQGIHPGILTERGLGPALRELAYSAPVPVDVDVALEQRLPEHVEVAAYYVVAEALANVSKYAQARSVAVEVTRANGRARLLVRDDGIGGADPARGSGLRGLSDRIEALGGTVELASPPGSGTSIRVEIPCG